MKKLSTATTNGIEKLQRLTIGLDLGDQSSHYFVLDSKTATSPKAMEGGSEECRRVGLRCGR